MDGVERTAPFRIGSAQVIVNTKFVIVQTGCKVTVVFDGDDSAVVVVPGKYSSHVTGICGNCNGNKKDDLQTKNGEDVSRAPNRYALVGDSYSVPDNSDDEGLR